MCVRCSRKTGSSTTCTEMFQLYHPLLPVPHPLQQLLMIYDVLAADIYNFLYWMCVLGGWVDGICGRNKITHITNVLGCKAHKALQSSTNLGRTNLATQHDCRHLWLQISGITALQCSLDGGEGGGGGNIYHRPVSFANCQ
jgi:hypothetical protein